MLKTKLTDALVEADNKALGIEMGGYFFAVFLIIGGTLAGTGYETLVENFAAAFGYGIVGTLLLLVGTKLSARFMLNGNAARAIDEGNISVGLVSASIFVSIGIIITGAISGDMLGDHVPTLIFFALGWIAFMIFMALYRALTDYDDYREIFSGNKAAAISYSANMIAVSMIIGSAVSGSFVSWSHDLLRFGESLTAVALLYFVRQFVVQGILLGSGFSFYGGRLDREIAGDKNTAAAAIEAATYIGSAILAMKLI